MVSKRWGAPDMSWGLARFSRAASATEVTATVSAPTRSWRTRAWGSSFVVGGGVEHRLSARAGVRLDFKHLDNQMSQLLLGVPFRF
jgi:hypothetical protein